MQFLNPIWFTALAALSIPVVIHLWNIRPGKTLKVGSISIFEEASPASSRSFKLLDILLLILRCLLLALIALLLAAPFWKQSTNPSAKGWTLIPRNYFGEAYHQYKNRIDSLVRRGYEFHYFEAGFPKEKLDQLLTNQTAFKSNNDSLSYWALAGLLDKVAPQNIPLEIFTPNGTTHFQSNQISANHWFNWNVFTPADSIKTWLSNAWVTDNGGIRVLQAMSKPSGISYQFTEIKNGDNNALFNVRTDNGKTSVHLKIADSINTVVNSQTETLAIYSSNNEADANYLKAALEAASRFMLKRVQVKVYHQPEQIPADVEWLFWLADAPVQAKNAKHVLYYAGGKVESDNSWLANNDDEHPALFKSIINNKADEQPVWTDATGRVILGRKQSGNPEFFPLYTRFNPTWNDLVWSDAFPNWLLRLMTPETSIAASNDRRAVSRLQVAPRFVAGQAPFNPLDKGADLSKYLWYLLAILFFAERSLAHKTQQSNG